MAAHGFFPLPVLLTREKKRKCAGTQVAEADETVMLSFMTMLLSMFRRCLQTNIKAAMKDRGLDYAVLGFLVCFVQIHDLTYDLVDGILRRLQRRCA